MKTAIQKLLTVALMLGCIGAQAATQIVGYVTITNTPAGLSSNIVVNIGSADTRYWTNSVLAAPTTSIQTTNSTAASATPMRLPMSSTWPAATADGAANGAVCGSQG